MILLVLPLLAATLLVGCTPPPPPPPPAPGPVAPTAEQAGQVQADIMKILPGSVVGKVSAVRGTMAAVSGISYTPAIKGQSIQFLDANSAVIANGTVSPTTDPDGSYLIVDFTPTAGGRAPITNDLAVYVPPGTH